MKVMLFCGIIATESRDNKMHIIKNFITVTTHRIRVMNLCFKCGLPWRGITHDLSKYSPTEFLESAKYYVGKYSPIAECRRLTGKSEAWLHHKGRNPHHEEYWIDTTGPVMMPYQYVVESICDKIAAGKTYKKQDYDQTEPLKYWYAHLGTIPIHKKTEKFYEYVLTDLSIHGEKYILNKKYMKKTYEKICGEKRKEKNSKRK